MTDTRKVERMVDSRPFGAERVDFGILQPRPRCERLPKALEESKLSPEQIAELRALLKDVGA